MMVKSLMTHFSEHIPIAKLDVYVTRIILKCLVAKPVYKESPIEPGGRTVPRRVGDTLKS